MIDKDERRKRLAEDFKKIAEITGRNESEMVAFAKNIPDELLDNFEKLGYSSEKKVRVESNLEIVEINEE